MQSITLTESIEWVGAIDWDRRIFDELVPTPDGTSYNAYLVRGTEKTALIDTVDPKLAEVLLRRLEGLERLDYVVANHAEQDHSGALPEILQRYPMAQVIATPKCKQMLVEHLGIAAGRVVGVEDGTMLPLGGLSLNFVHFPWVHWPETMLTYVPERGVLFSCDLFGAHLAQSPITVVDPGRTVNAAKLYFGSIMMPYRAIIAQRFAKVEALAPKMIAPSHGPAFPEPALILNGYREWLSPKPKNLVALPYISMHHSTESMVFALVDGLARRGVEVVPVNMTTLALDKLALALVDAATLAFGSPIFLSGPHPNVAYAAMIANALKPRAKFAAVLGSFGWGGKLAEPLLEMVSGLKLEALGNVLAKGLPTPSDRAAIDALAETITAKHQALLG